MFFHDFPFAKSRSNTPPARSRRPLVRAVAHASLRAGLPALLLAAPAFADTTDATTLRKLVVVEREGPDAVTEGSGTYKAAAVTVGKMPMNPKDIPASVSVISRQRMDDQNMQTVEDALRNATGVTAVTYGDGTAYFQARGYPVEVQYDGLPANTGLQYLPQFDLALYDHIEVLRGPTGLLQGFGSPGGTVNLVRKRARDTFGFTGSLSAGSWDNYRTELDVTGPVSDDGRIRGRAGLAAQDRDFFIDQSHTRQGLFYGSLEADLSPATRLTVGGAVQRINQDAPDYGQSIYADGTLLDAKRSGFYGVDWGYGDTDLSEWYADLSHDFGNDWQGRAAVNYRSAEMKSKYGYIDGAIDPADNSADYWLQAQKDRIRWVGVDINAYGPFEWLGRSHQAMIGVNYAQRHQRSLSGGTAGGVVDAFDIHEPEIDIPYTSGTESDSSQYGLYGQLTFKPTDALSLIVGGRQNWYRSSRQDIVPSVDATTHDPDRNKFTPYFGAVLALSPQLSAYASYAEIFTISEAWQTTAAGDTLPPRTGRQYEAGLKADLLDGRVGASFALFRIEDRDRAIGDIAHPGRWLAQGAARSQGVEAEITGRLLPGWELQAGYTYLHTQYTDDPDNQGSILDTEEPRHLFKLWTTYRLDDDWRVGGGVRAQSRTTRNEVTWQGGYALADAQIGYRINANLDLALNVNNLFDRRYYARVPSTYYGLYGEPRNLMVTLRAHY